jgi:hypothetical protein
MKNRAVKMVVKVKNKCTTKKAVTIKPKLEGEKRG